MSKSRKSSKAKVGLLELAKQLGSVLDPQVDGSEPRQFLCFNKLALAEISMRNPIEKNRVDGAIEKAIERPAWGQVWIANELKKQGQSISQPRCTACGSRMIWRP